MPKRRENFRRASGAPLVFLRPRDHVGAPTLRITFQGAVCRRNLIPPRPMSRLLTNVVGFDDGPFPREPAARP